MTPTQRTHLAYLSRLCHALRQNQTQTKMSAHALAICWTPTLVGKLCTAVPFVQNMIEFANFVFPDVEYPEINMRIFSIQRYFTIVTLFMNKSYAVYECNKL